jgi:hypothetical protein
MDASRHRLALIELLERDGRVRRSIEVRHWPVLIGRALDNDIVLDDPHVAAHHLSLAPDEQGLLQMTVGATRNGVQVGPRTAVEGETCPVPAAAEVWQVGATRLRARLPADELEPERPLGLAVTGARPLTTLAAALAAWALLLMEHAVELDPGSTLNDWLLFLLGVPAAAVGWCIAWALGSRLLQHRFEFWAHFAVLVKGALGVMLIDLLLPLAAYALSWEWLSRIAPVAEALVAGAMVYRHASLVVPVRRWWVAGGVAGLLALTGLVVGTLNVQRLGRLFPELYLSSLPPPAFRLAPGVPVKEFVRDARALREPLDRQVAREPASP